MMRFAVAAGAVVVLAGLWPASGRAHHPPTIECQHMIQSCSRDIPRCIHLLDVVQQECRIWRSECRRTGNGECERLATRCEDVWSQLREICEPRIDRCQDRVEACEMGKEG